MKLVLEKSILLKVLSQVAGVVERKHTLPILSNIKFDLSATALVVTASDLEVELVAVLQLAEGVTEREGSATIPARKLLDIVKALPNGIQISVDVGNDGRCTVKAGKSKFVISTLPAADFPHLTTQAQGDCLTTVKQDIFKMQLEKASFAMAVHDVRYYLTGMLFEAYEGLLRTVATDGHRLAMSEAPATIVGTDAQVQAIVPRKAIFELMRLLQPLDQDLSLRLGKDFLSMSTTLAKANEEDADLEIRFTSKLIDGSYPDYRRVLPRNGNKVLNIRQDHLKETLQRVSILSNEKLRGVALQATANQLNISTNNPEQDQADENFEINYSGEAVSISFNSQYLIDVLNVLDGNEINMTLLDSNSSALIHDPSDDRSVFVVMPIRV